MLDIYCLAFMSCLGSSPSYSVSTKSSTRIENCAKAVKITVFTNDEISMALTSLASTELMNTAQEKMIKENSAMHFSVAPMLDWID